MDKSEEQIAKEREAVEAMRNAKSNMSAAIACIETLESALKSAAAAISRFKPYVPTGGYAYPLNGKPVKLHDEMDAAYAAAMKPLA